MTLEEQIKVMTAFQNGEKIYVKSRYDSTFADYKLITDKNYVFDFNNSYSIGKPKSWEESLNDIKDPREALRRAAQYLTEKRVVEEGTRDFGGGNKETISFLTRNNFYRLWNIAMAYGRANKHAKAISDEEDSHI